MKIRNNEKEIQNRANWLYHSNGGSMNKMECARQAVKELTDPSFVKDLCCLYDMTIEDYMCDVAENIK